MFLQQSHPASDAVTEFFADDAFRALLPAPLQELNNQMESVRPLEVCSFIHNAVQSRDIVPLRDSSGQMVGAVMSMRSPDAVDLHFGADPVDITVYLVPEARSRLSAAAIAVATEAAFSAGYGPVRLVVPEDHPDLTYAAAVFGFEAHDGVTHQISAASFRAAHLEKVIEPRL